MSTYLYLRCDSHDPPLENDSQSGQHLYDLDQIFRDIEDRELIVAAWNDDMYPRDSFRYATAAFLAGHPHCQITVVDEYGRIHRPDGTITEQEAE